MPNLIWSGYDDALSGEGRGEDLDDQIAAMLQLVLHRDSFRVVRDNGHAGFVGPPGVPVEDGQAHRRTFPRLSNLNLPE